MADLNSVPGSDLDPRGAPDRPQAAATRPGRDAPSQLTLADDLAPDRPGSSVEMTIGEVLTALRGDFPDLTISKIRYYERQGLLTPARSAAGYRKFSGADVSRLHFVLTAARDHYLPLRVIRERLAAADSSHREAVEAVEAGQSAPGQSPAEHPGDPSGATLPSPAPAAPASGGTMPISAALFDFEPGERRLTRGELMRESGLSGDELTELEAYGLLAPRGAGSSYEAAALTVARIVAELRQYGFQARHLRPVKAAVDREVGLIEQTLAPLVRQPSREARARAEGHARGYAALSVRLHVALLEAALAQTLR